MGWISISPERAKAHPLYGINGWLLWFAIGQIVSIALLAIPALTSFLISPRQAQASFLLVLIFIATQFPMLYSLFRLRPNFRMVAMTTILISGFVWMVVVSLINVGDGAGRVIVSAIGWTWYLQVSRRVSVTFEHRVRDNDPLLTLQKDNPIPKPELVDFRKGFQRKIWMAILTAGLLFGISKYYYWKSDLQAKYNAEQVALINKQMEESVKVHAQISDELNKSYHDLSNSVSMLSAAKSKREAEELKTKFGTMAKIIDQQRNDNEQAWQERLALINNSRLPKESKDKSIALARDKRASAASLIHNILRLEQEKVEALMNVADFIDTNRNYLSVKGDNIAFKNAALLAEYNLRMSTIKRKNEEQRILQEKYAAIQGSTRY